MNYIKRLIMFIFFLLLLVSCKVVMKNKYNEKIINDRNVNVELLLKVITPLTWNYDIDGINEIFKIEINKSDLLGIVLLDNVDYFWTGKIKNNNEIIDLTELNYLLYLSKNENDKVDLIEKTIMYNEESIGSLKIFFKNIE